MRLTSIVVHILAVACAYAIHVVEDRDVCHNNACQKALEPDEQKPHVHFSRARNDCSTFFGKTVTPATSTITKIITTRQALATSVIVQTSETITSTTTTTISFSNAQRRQVTQTHKTIPTYASACSNAASYSSACACIGIKHSTKTVATPRTTVTKTITHSITSKTTTATTFTSTDVLVSTVVYPQPQETAFQLLASGGGVDGKYVDVSSADNSNAQFVSNFSSASTFSISPETGRLITSGNIANIDVNMSAEAVFWNDPDSSFINGGISTYLLNCSLSETNSGVLSCSAGPDTILQVCPARTFRSLAPGPALVIGDTLESSSGCIAVTLSAV